MNYKKTAFFSLTLLSLSCFLPALSFAENDFDPEADVSQEETVADDSDDMEEVVQAAGNINYVPMPVPTNLRQISLGLQGPAGVQSTLKNVGSTMKEFYERMSRNKIKITPQLQTLGQNSKGPNNMLLVLKPGAASHVPIIGNAISAKHELGHEFGLGHASTRIWETQSVVKQAALERDPFDVMTITPGQVSLNAPHIHFMKWFSPTEEAYAEVGKEYTLRLINDGNKDFTSLKSLYYQVPGSERVFWFSYIKLTGKGWNTPKGMPGTAVVVHSAVGGGANTFLEGIIGLEDKTLIRSGLILKLSEAKNKTVKVTVTLDPNWILQTK
jgi:hypothetical protein